MTATTTATLGRFVWHELLTTDPAAAQDFYRAVVGWNTTKWDNSGTDYTMWMAGDAPIGGVMSLPKESSDMARPNWLPYIETPDVDATMTQAATLGATVLIPAQTVAEVGRFAVLQDPLGAAFAVITPEMPTAPETDPARLEFSWHELVTSDPQAALSFYEKLFGWESKGEFDMGEKGLYRMYGRDRFTYGGAMNTPAPPHWMSYVSVEDSADAAVERAKSAGGTVIVDPVDVPGGSRIAIMMDPQGAAFAVHSKTAP